MDGSSRSTDVQMRDNYAAVESEQGEVRKHPPGLSAEAAPRRSLRLRRPELAWRLVGLLLGRPQPLARLGRLDGNRLGGLD